jgi:hypothetical protein
LTALFVFPWRLNLYSKLTPIRQDGRSIRTLYPAFEPVMALQGPFAVVSAVQN